MTDDGILGRGFHHPGSRIEQGVRNERYHLPVLWQGTKCHTRFTKEIRAAAFTVDNDPRSDYVGPVTTKVAKVICWVVLGLLLVAFVLATELSGNGVTGH